MIELLNIDCMEYMAGCEDNAFDLAIVDPPYGIGWDKETEVMSAGYRKNGTRRPATVMQEAASQSVTWKTSEATMTFWCGLRTVKSRLFRRHGRLP